MNCEEIDLIGVLDGECAKSTAHVEGCDRCRTRLTRLANLVGSLADSYRNRILEEASQDRSVAERENLPSKLRRQVARFRRARLIQDVRHRLGLDLESARRIVERMTGGDGLVSPAPASPRDLVEPEVDGDADPETEEQDGDGTRRDDE